MTRPTKRSIPPVSRTSRPTRRGIVRQTVEPATEAEPDVEVDEPFLSSRPTRREISLPPEPVSTLKEAGVRGQFSIADAHGVPADEVSGTIEVAEGGRTRRTPSQAPAEVSFVSATRRQVTVMIDDRAVTLDRHAAIALASKIFTAFESDSD